MDEDNNIRCGLIRNTCKKPGWDKVESMIDIVETSMKECLGSSGKLHAWVCEGQYAGGRGRSEHAIRNGWVAASVYTMGKGKCPRIIAIPATWTRNVAKEIRHDKLKRELPPMLEWDWVGPPAPLSKMHNIYDAIALAKYGLQMIKDKR